MSVSVASLTQDGLALVLSGLLRSKPSARRFKAACRAAWRPAFADRADGARRPSQGLVPCLAASLVRSPGKVRTCEAPGLSTVRVDRTRGDEGQAPTRT